ncbi:MAG: KOW domain-containing RNA-binding protein [Defluviitaleaceae bacterium]|nr:KOW domain-containing RNA-binding protein [Defluviitaleaceae bacterium]
MQIGQIVYSKKGRDKALPFVVCKIEDEYLYLSDGKLRKIENPKKKKIMHVSKTNYVDSNLSTQLENFETTQKKVKNSDIMSAIKVFLNKGV